MQCGQNKYTKYLFLSLLVYTMFILTGKNDVNIGMTEIIIGLVLPYLPVWLSSHYAKKFDKELAGTFLNILTIITPAIIVILEGFFLVTQSLTGNETGSGLIAAFVVGTLVFFGISLISTVFVKSHTSDKTA